MISAIMAITEMIKTVKNVLYLVMVFYNKFVNIISKNNDYNSKITEGLLLHI